MHSHLFLLLCYYLQHGTSSTPDPYCDRGVLHEIYDICGTVHCAYECDHPSYCYSNSTRYEHCCCDGIISSSNSCISSGPPCLYESHTHNVSDYIIFGFQVSTQPNMDQTTAKMLTLFWNNYQYECTVAAPQITTESVSFYACDSSSADIKACPTILSPSEVSHGLQIDYLGNTSFLIDHIIVKQITNKLVSNLFIINTFISSNSSDIIPHHNTSVGNEHNLVIFDGIDTTKAFSMNIVGFTQSQSTDAACSKANFIQTVPDAINRTIFSEEICVFGAHHAFLDGTYTLIAWDLDVYGPIYYNDIEHKYLYPDTSGSYFQWQIHEDYSSDTSYSYCNMRKSDSDRFYVQYCDIDSRSWKTDINLLDDLQDRDDYETEAYMTIKACNHNTNSANDSITFEIEIVSWNNQRAGALSLTLFWNDTKHKCTVYPTTSDYDYSCNTELNAVECRSKHDNPVHYGLQIDVFSDDEDHIIAHEIRFKSITLRYMRGNIVADMHKIERFCVKEECEDVLYVANHTLVAFTENYFNDTYANITHTQSLSQCIPDGYSVWLNKYILVQQNLSWYDAASYCEEVFNTSLATITDEDDLFNAVALREHNNSNEDVWIGFNNIDQNGWQWIDGTEIYDNLWADDKPDDNRFEVCAEMSGVNAMGEFNNDDCEKLNVFLCHNLISDTIPAWASNISQEICVFGSRHSYLDGTYAFIAWNQNTQAPIYYDENEHKFLYLILSDDEYQWQIHESYHSDDYYSHCEVEDDINATYDVSQCTHWKADITGKGTAKTDPYVTVKACDNTSANDSDSITFEIETDWSFTGAAITLTLYWEESTYKCTVYSDNDDQDYSCNTMLSARQCDERWNANPVKYGLQIDFFGDDDDEEDMFYIKSITIKYMRGNVVRDAHKMEHFCDQHDTGCAHVSDELHVFNHTLVNFTYKHTNNDVYYDEDALHAHITHSKSLAACVPNGYNIEDAEARYILVEESMSWDDANAFCETEYDASLATILDETDLLNALVLREMNQANEDIWIGLNAPNHYLVWQWTDSTSCDYTDTGICEHDDHWADLYPIADESGDAICVKMSGDHALGHFQNIDCDDDLIFLCNVPTPKPTPSPSFAPTLSPTHAVDLHDIAIIMHSNVSEDNPRWISFALENIDLSCGGYIEYVQISDTYPYVWVNYTRNISGYYTFVLNETFDAPVGIQIARKHMHGIEILNQSNVIEDFIGGQHFDYRTNFCTKLHEPAIDNYYIMYSVMALIIFISFIILCTGSLDAKCCRKNDHFVPLALVSSLFQVLDMVSDIFFCYEVWTRYDTTDEEDNKRIYFLIITILSMTFIVLPVIISVFQLHQAASKDWIGDNRIREWLKSFAALLYTTSIITGSSFNAIQIFNSDLYGLHLFYMGLQRSHIMKFSARKLHSIIMFENVPQLLLSAYYMYILGTFNLVSITQMFFSTLSIIVTTITIMLQSKIDKTQDELYVRINVSGQGVMDHRKQCKNQINWLKNYLARDVLGVNKKWVQVQKPYAGAVVKGLKFNVYISFIHDNEKAYELLEVHYNRLLQQVMDNRELQKKMREEWGMREDEELKINHFGCKFIWGPNKRLTKELSIDMLSPRRSANVEQQQVFTTDDDDDDDDDELQGLKDTRHKPQTETNGVKGESSLN